MDAKIKYNINDYTIEYCPWCNSDQVIFAKGVTACPNCDKPLAPCSMCNGCDYSTCQYGCDGTENDKYKTVTNRKITQEEQDLYKYL